MHSLAFQVEENLRTKYKRVEKLKKIIRYENLSLAKYEKAYQYQQRLYLMNYLQSQIL